MKLHTDLIFYRLSQKYTVRYTGKKDRRLIVKRPIFYQPGSLTAGFTVIVSATDAESKSVWKTATPDNLYISLGGLKTSSDIKELCIINIEADVAPVSIFNEIQEMFMLFDDWDESLKTICYEGGTFSDLIDSCNKVIYDPISLVDKSFYFICYSKELSKQLGLVDVFIDVDNKVRMDVVNDFVTDKTFSNLYKRRDIFMFSHETGDVLCKNIFFNDKFVGRLGMRPGCSDKFLIKYDMAILDHLFVYIYNLYSKHMSFNEKKITLNNIRNLILCALADKEVSTEQWGKALSENGWSLNDKLQLIQFRTNPRYDKNMYASYLGAEIERNWMGCAHIEYKDQLLLLVNLHKFASSIKKDFFQALAYLLRDNLLIAGVSRTFYEINDIHAAYKQTETALEFGVKKTPTLWYYKFDDYVLSYMLNGCKGSFAAEQICSGKLLDLKKHDTDKNTEYYKTLRTFFSCSFNATAASKKLFIHRSSFISRMEKIQEFINIDYDSKDEVLYLSLSFEILEGKL